MKSKEKICLLIDDDQDDQEIFTMALQEVSASTQCVVVSDCSEALEKLSQDNLFVPDYIFLDFNMPRENGRKCLEEIKKRDHLRNIPVVMYSTSLSKKDIEETKKIGAHGYIVKPNSISALTAELHNFFTGYTNSHMTTSSMA